MHIQVSAADWETTRIITLYEPDPARVGRVSRTKVTMSTFKCYICGGETARDEFVSEVLEVDGRRVLVEHIPARICMRCGEAAFSRETTERIRLLVHGAGRPARTVPLDVFELA